MKRSVLVAAAMSVAAVAAGFVLMTTASVAAGSLPTLTIALTPKTVTVGGSKVSGAVNVVTTVTGEQSDGPTLILLKPGVTPADLNKAFAALGPKSAPDGLDNYGSIVFDAVATHGTPASAQTVLQPGTYVASGNGNGEAVFTVTQAIHPAALPTPGATVTASSPVLQGQRTATTDVNGVYFIKGLPAGTYLVSFEMPSFRTVTKENVALNVGSTIDVPQTMALAGVVETVNVTGEPPKPAALTVPTLSQAYTKAELESLPVGQSPTSAGGRSSG